MLKEEKVSIRVKLAALWISVMFCYVYADIKALFETGFVEQIIDGNLAGMVVNQQFLFFSALLMSIPPLMIMLTTLLPAGLARVLNIVLAVLHILLAVAILIFGKGIWAYYYWYSFLEILFHVIIVVLAVKWPKAKAVEEGAVIV